MKNTVSTAPSSSEQFNKIYNSSLAHWAWGDVRIPKELQELVKSIKPKTSLELGCGLGRFSIFMAKQGVQATGVDFSSVAIENARKSVIGNEFKPAFMVGDVTNLEMIQQKFDVSFDVGCFHCLNEDNQDKYVSEIYRLLNPGASLLIWALDSSPSGIRLDSNYITKVFENKFQLANSSFSRRRIIASHWYTLIRKN